jgi:hypothetical protein
LRVPRASAIAGVSCLVASSMINLFIWRRLLAALREHRLDSGHFPAQKAHPARLLELAALLLQTEMQALLAQVALLRQELIRAHFLNIFKFHYSLVVRSRRDGG